MDQVQVLRDEADKVQFDASVILGKKPGKYYRWGRDEPKNLLMRRLDGYDVCIDPDVKSALGESTRMKKGMNVDETIRFGDLILLETSQENHDRLIAQENERIVRRTSGIMSSYRHAIQRATGRDDLVIEEHAASPDREGKGYGKGYSEEDMATELAADPMVEGARRPSWRDRKE